MATQAETTEQLRETASSQESSIEELVAGAFLAVIDSVTLAEITRALNDEDAAAAEEAAHTDRLGEELTPVAVGILAAIAAGANLGKSELPASLQAAVPPVDMLRDSIQDWARVRTGELISGITETSREAIRNAVANGLESDRSARRIAREIRNVIGLTAPQQRTLANYRAALEGSGLKRETVEQRLVERADKMRRHRARVIAQTEAFTATAMGRHLYWMQLIEDGHLDSGVQRKWFTALDERVCPICRPMHGQVRGFQEPFQTGGGGSVLTSPAHPVCRCGVILISPQAPA